MSSQEKICSPPASLVPIFSNWVSSSHTNARMNDWSLLTTFWFSSFDYLLHFMMPKIHLFLYEIGSSQVFPNQTKAYGRETDTQHQLYTYWLFSKCLKFWYCQFTFSLSFLTFSPLTDFQSTWPISYGGIRQRALSMEDHWWLRGSLLHGSHRWRTI